MTDQTTAETSEPTIEIKLTETNFFTRWPCTACGGYTEKDGGIFRHIGTEYSEHITFPESALRQTCRHSIGLFAQLIVAECTTS